MRKIDLAYLAGIFDGEGSISIARVERKGRKNPRYQLAVSLSICTPYIPNLFKMGFGGSINVQERGGKRRPIWTWRPGIKEGLCFLEVINPYLRLKKDEALLALQFEQGKEKRHFCPGHSRTEKEIVLFEAEKILLHKMHDKTGFRGNHIPLDI